MNTDTHQPTDVIRTDFDRLALLSDQVWDHNQHYHDFLLRHIPPACTHALDIGCGTGVFTRLLAARADHVVAIDLSPMMITVARERSAHLQNIDYQVADALAWPFPVEAYDCVASTAALHHLPLDTMLHKIKGALKGGGILVVLDLCRAEGLGDTFSGALAIAVSTALKFAKTGRLRDRREVREAWAEHAKIDSFLTLAEVREECAAVLPGAAVKKHLLWRYSIVWRKPVF